MGVMRQAAGAASLCRATTPAPAPRPCAPAPAAAAARRRRGAPSLLIAAAAAGGDDGGAVATTASASAGAGATAGRRALLAAGAAAALSAAASLAPQPAPCAAAAAAGGYEPMEALRGKDYGKPRMQYPDYVSTPSGLQYKDLLDGAGAAPAPGDLVVVDWSGFTLGYYGRPFEARNKPKGGSFTGEDKDFLRFRLGRGEVIPAFDEAVAGMRVGGIRRVVVPVELGYPEDGGFRKLGPKPSTFSGERALDFVLGNRGMIDKTLLFDIELIRKE